MEANNRKRKKPRCERRTSFLNISVILAVWLVALTFPAMSSEYTEYTSTDWALYVYSSEEVVGGSASLNAQAYSDDYFYSWNDYDIVFDGFSADIEVDEERSTESELWVYLRNLEGNSDSTRKSIQFIQRENTDEPVAMTVSFNLYTKAQYISRYLVAAVAIVATFAVLMSQYYWLKKGELILLYILYNITYIPTIVGFMEKCLRVSPTDTVCISLSTVFLLFVIFSILAGKKIFHTGVYTLLILFFSTYFLYQMSYMFSSYYIEVYDVFMDEDMWLKYCPTAWWETGKTITSEIFWENVKCKLTYCSYSFRYFFSFPTEDMYGLVAAYQFMIGKLYELTAIASVANYIIRLVKVEKAIPSSVEDDSKRAERDKETKR